MRPTFRKEDDLQDDDFIALFTIYRDLTLEEDVRLDAAYIIWDKMCSKQVARFGPEFMGAAYIVFIHALNKFDMVKTPPGKVQRLSFAAYFHNKIRKRLQEERGYGRSQTKRDELNGFFLNIDDIEYSGDE